MLLSLIEYLIVHQVSPSPGYTADARSNSRKSMGRQIGSTSRACG